MNIIPLLSCFVTHSIFCSVALAEWKVHPASEFDEEVRVWAGTGVALHRSGSKYSGQWSENLKEGKGEYWYSNGDYYAGSFHNDLMHGPGRYVSADGTVFEGTFVADERDGSGVVIYSDGRRYSSTWSAGKDINPAGAPASAKPYLMLGVMRVAMRSMGTLPRETNAAKQAT